jgi:hypothetical protein
MKMLSIAVFAMVWAISFILTLIKSPALSYKRAKDYFEREKMIYKNN